MRACPFLFYGAPLTLQRRPEEFSCIKGSCAWWEERYKKCSIILLASPRVNEEEKEIKEC